MSMMPTHEPAPEPSEKDVLIEVLQELRRLNATTSALAEYVFQKEEKKSLSPFNPVQVTINNGPNHRPYSVEELHPDDTD